MGTRATVIAPARTPRVGPAPARFTRALLATVTSIAIGFGLGGLALAPTADAAATAYVATGSVNVRSGPGTSYKVLGVLAAGDAVSGGVATDGWVKVGYRDATGYVSARYLRAASGPDSLPAITYKARTTAVLAMRREPAIDAASNGNLKTGSEVGLTGTHAGSYSQIVRKNTVAWVLTGYLRMLGDGPALPTAVGKRYVTAVGLNIRATSAADGTVVGAVAKGTVLLITGTTAGDRSQVIFEGARRWASTKYLSKTRPDAGSDGGSLGSESLDRVNANAKAIVRAIRAEFPTIKTIHGWRMSSDYSSDHPSGRALDIMIPKYSTAAGKALGNKIARYLQENHKKFHVHYLIWRQRQWNVERNLDYDKGWRKMADRGGVTANHYDHVHVSVYD